MEPYKLETQLHGKKTKKTFCQALRTTTPLNITANAAGCTQELEIRVTTNHEFTPVYPSHVAANAATTTHSKALHLTCLSALTLGILLSVPVPALTEKCKEREKHG